jgi:hypothetical protein
MGRASSPALAPSISIGARTCTFSSGDLHQIIGIVSTLHRKGAAKWLRRVTKRAPRTVKYWLSGEYAPRGDDALKIARALRAELDAERAKLEQFELNLQ